MYESFHLSPGGLRRIGGNFTKPRPRSGEGFFSTFETLGNMGSVSLPATLALAMKPMPYAKATEWTARHWQRPELSYVGTRMVTTMKTLARIFHSERSEESKTVWPNDILLDSSLRSE